MRATALVKDNGASLQRVSFYQNVGCTLKQCRFTLLTFTTWLHKNVLHHHADCPVSLAPPRLRCRHLLSSLLVFYFEISFFKFFFYSCCCYHSRWLPQRGENLPVHGFNSENGSLDIYIRSLSFNFPGM